MQENNFEKEVRQKLDELQLAPSEPVWQRIEASIKKKKRDRLVFWLLPLFLVTGGSALWYAAAWQTKNMAQQQPDKKQAQPQSFSKPHTAVTAKTTATQSDKPQPRTQKNYAGIIVRSAMRKENKIHRENSSTATYQNNRTPVVHQPKTASGTETNSFSANPVKNNAAVILNNTVADEVPAQPLIRKKEEAQNTPDTVIKAGTNTTDSSLHVLPVQHKNVPSKKALQWSIVGRAGVSNIVDALVTGFGMKSFNTSQLEYNNGSGSDPVFPGTNQSRDSLVRRLAPGPAKGVQFAVGAAVKKPVGKRSFFVTGIQYSFYSYHLTVNTPLPVAASRISLYSLQNAMNATSRFSGTDNRHTNRFHYIELPIGFEYQLLKRVPLHVQHGVSLSQLISSYVMQYDYTFNQYYRADDIRKTGLNIFTSVEYTIWSGKSFSLQAGPQLQYGLRNIFKNTSGAHLLSGGLAINMAF